MRKKKKIDESTVELTCNRTLRDFRKCRAHNMLRECNLETEKQENGTKVVLRTGKNTNETAKIFREKPNNVESIV